MDIRCEHCKIIRYPKGRDKGCQNNQCVVNQPAYKKLQKENDKLREALSGILAFVSKGEEYDFEDIDKVKFRIKDLITLLTIPLASALGKRSKVIEALVEFVDEYQGRGGNDAPGNIYWQRKLIEIYNSAKALTDLEEGER